MLLEKPIDIDYHSPFFEHKMDNTERAFNFFMTKYLAFCCLE